ncbi:hypothetical protein ACLBXM_09030 [Xanthobacteraceae bacterium A53D]
MMRRLLPALLALAFFAAPLSAPAAPQDDAALAAVTAFLKDPEGKAPKPAPRPMIARDLSALANAGKKSLLGAPKLVYADGTVAFVAVEASVPELTQTLYVRARLKDGQWAVEDWTPVQSLAANAQMLRSIETATDAQWEKMREQLGAAGADFDAAAMRENMRLMLGSDEVLVEMLQPDLDAAKALCRRVAKSSAIGPTPTLPNDPVRAKALQAQAAKDPDLAQLLKEAAELDVQAFWREQDSGVISLGGVAEDGSSPMRLGLARYLLCTAEAMAPSLHMRMTGQFFVGLRDLGDNTYFVRGMPH